MRTCRLGPADRVLQLASTSFDVSLEQISRRWSPARRWSVRGTDHWSTSELHRQVKAHGVTVADLSPAYWRELAREWMEQPGSPSGARCA